MSDLVLLSGGMDSTTLLAHALDTGEVGLALAVDYRQRHRREIGAATAVAAHYGVPFKVLDLTGWGRLLQGSGSSLTDTDVPVPHGHYAAPSMVQTIVPNRNATMLMAAAGVALAHRCDRVLTAVHAGDHAIYPDCRPEFIDAADTAVRLGTDERVRVEAPFVHRSKTWIAGYGATLRVPYELTWSCYEGGDVHCGSCGTCTERKEAFTDAAVPDPTVYA